MNNVHAASYAEYQTAVDKMIGDVSYSAAKLWWTWLVRAILWGILGIVFVVNPELGLNTLILVIGAWFIADGVLDILGSIFTDGLDLSRRLLMLILGILCLVAGIAVIAWPDLTAVTLSLVAGIFALLYGALLLFSSVFDDAHLMPRWLSFLLGLAAAIFGLYLILNPEENIKTLVQVIGAFMIISAVVYLLTALQMHGLKSRLEAQGFGK